MVQIYTPTKNLCHTGLRLSIEFQFFSTNLYLSIIMAELSHIAQSDCIVRGFLHQAALLHNIVATFQALCFQPSGN